MMKEDEANGCWKKVMETIDMDLLKSGSFLIVAIGCGVIYTANTSFQMLYPLFLQVSKLFRYLFRNTGQAFSLERIVPKIL